MVEVGMGQLVLSMGLVGISDSSSPPRVRIWRCFYSGGLGLLPSNMPCNPLRVVVGEMWEWGRLMLTPQGDGCGSLYTLELVFQALYSYHCFGRSLFTRRASVTHSDTGLVMWVEPPGRDNKCFCWHSNNPTKGKSFLLLSSTVYSGYFPRIISCFFFTLLANRTRLQKNTCFCISLVSQSGLCSSHSHQRD